MSIGSFFRSIGRGINKGLKATKAISTLAPVLLPGVGSVVGKLASNAGYRKGGRVRGMAKGGRVKPRGMRKGGKVGRPKKK